MHGCLNMHSVAFLEHMIVKKNKTDTPLYTVSSECISNKLSSPHSNWSVVF